jgi:hypothetical protein
MRNAAIAVFIVTAFAGAYYVGLKRRSGRFNVFAQCLTAKQVRMYGAYWCPHCADQKEMFGSSFHYITYKECGVRGSRQESDGCIRAGVKHFPTWQFADGERVEGTLPLKTLAEKTGCSLP